MIILGKVYAKCRNYWREQGHWDGRSNFDVEKSNLCVLSDILWWWNEGDWGVGFAAVAARTSAGQIVISCATTCPMLVVSSLLFQWLTEFGSCSGQLYIVGCLFGGAEGNPRRILQKCVRFEKNKTKWKGYFWNFDQQWQWLCAAVPSQI